MGYRTLVEFEEGLRKTVEWYRKEQEDVSTNLSAQR
jgi:dTDP-D-glucose 4,6-dehydratase